MGCNRNCSVFANTLYEVFKSVMGLHELSVFRMPPLKSSEITPVVTPVGKLSLWIASVSSANSPDLFRAKETDKIPQ
jgi:hypothetical protein